MFNILIFGANGQLGKSLEKISHKYKYNFFFKDKNELDILDEKSIKNAITTHGINAIINACAYTLVDKAEEDKDTANSINHLAVKFLAGISKQENIKLIHISTDYVFDGKHYMSYKENDMVSPINTYGQTKLDGEKAIQKHNLKDSIIIRTSWLYSEYGSNFLKTILKASIKNNELKVVNDQIGTPTYATYLAKAILDILPKINNYKTEIYHYSNEGVASWFDFAKEIVQILKIDCKINPIATKDYNTQAIRPYFSVLNKSKIKKDFSIDIPYWKDGIYECLSILKER